jgi:hypothetical protein
MKANPHRFLLVFLFVLVAGYSCKTDPVASNQYYQPSEPQMKNNSGTRFGAIGETQVISIAEHFVAENGYTDLPPMEDRSKLFHESLEGGSTPDEILAFRQNTLERSAYGIKKALRNGAGWREGTGWTVAFRFQGDNAKLQRAFNEYGNSSYEDYIRKYGRAVSMDLNGNNIRVEHEDIPLEFVSKIGR